MIRTIEDGEIVTGMRAKLRSLAMTQRRLSHQYQAFAREDEAAGRLTAYRSNIAEARRLINSARWNLQWARTFDERIAA